jgi:hypothetical protein
MSGAMSELIEQVDELFRESDARIFELLHKIANLVMKGDVE